MKNNSPKKKEYAAGESIQVYSNINKDYFFTIPKGEIFLTEPHPVDKEWRKIYFEGKLGYISNSKKIFTIDNTDKNIHDEIFIIHIKQGVKLCKEIPINRKCLTELKKIDYLEKIKFIKSYQLNDGSADWFKVSSDESIGYINRFDLIPDNIFKPDQVESFKIKFQKICSTKVDYLNKNTNICYSTKIFENGDADESWKERVYFMIDRDSNSFAYGRKYLETFGILFNVDAINENTYKVYFLDALEFNIKHIIVTINLNRKVLYGPLPETIMPETYKQESDEILEFKNGLNYFK